MAGIFTGHDLLELAMQVERNGFSFYRAIEGSAKTGPVREVCQFLAGEEEKHLALFQGLLDSVGRRPLPESYAGEYQAYIEALAASRVFVGEEAWRRLAQQARNDTDALNTAILFEKDTILFFSEMKGLLARRDQPVLAEIVAQEKGHIRRLVEVRDRAGRG
ncbi:MAG: ferritin family protein [Chloroflexi bacterium]|nr:ferritin family protein [Chloroflexota bacterium]